VIATAKNPKPRTLSFREFTDEMLALDDLLWIDEGEYSAEIEQLDLELRAKLAEKVDDCIEYRATLMAQAAAAKLYAAQVKQRAERIEARLKWLDSYILSEMERSGRDRFQGDVLALRRQKNPDSVEVSVLPAALPAEFQRVIPEVREADKKALAAALKAGATIDGVSFSAPTYHLRVA
jgi:hypothetical protein